MYTSTGLIVKISSDIFVADKQQKRLVHFPKNGSLLKENDILEVTYETAEISPVWKNTCSGTYASFVDETWEFHKVSNPHVSRV